MLGIRRYLKSSIDLFQGDITDFVCDGMVNAANTTLRGGAGVDGAIHDKGGPTILRECMKFDGCPVGSAVSTTAGDLPARYVIHTVGPIWTGGQSGEANLLDQAYSSSLHKAHELGIRHIAFPSISTGAFKFPLDKAAKIAMNSTKLFLNSQPECSLRITFVLFDSAHYETFQKALFKTFLED